VEVVAKAKGKIEFAEKYRKKYVNSLRSYKRERSMKPYLMARWASVPGEITMWICAS
jgi:hypothetical protein